jgi:2-C-methyl-D-erythritol 4-phosphate cytidylyltransferase
LAVALIVAAGRGERLGAPGPKAFDTLRGRPLLAWSLAAVRAAPSVTSVVVARPPGSDPVAGVVSVEGGTARSESVRRALEAAPAGEELVVVHDAARPLATPELFEAALAAVRGGADAAVAAAPVTDTIKEAGEDHAVRRTVERSSLWAVQTPQAFRREALSAALGVADDVLAAATDDAWLVERAGGSVVVVPAPRENLKVTTPLDLRVAELLLESRTC